MATVTRGERIIDLYRAEGVDTARVLIKIAATWEGIEAARILEQRGIHTNLTLLFSPVQAVACGAARVQLISPFVGRIYDWYKKQAGAQWDEAAMSGPNDPGVQSVQLQGGCIGIENKPWRHSRDSRQQLLDYCDHLQGLHGSWMLIYLGHQAPDPSSLPPQECEEHIRSGHFVYLLWPEVLGWLQDSLPRIQAQKVRWFVEELRNHLQRHMGNDLPEAAMNHIAEAFTANQQTLATAFQVRDSLAEWQKQKLAQLQRQLDTATKTAGITLHWGVSDNLLKASKPMPFALELGWGPELLLCFAWWHLQVDPEDFYWGIHLSPEQAEKTPRKLIDALKRHAAAKFKLPSETPEDSWPYWMYVHSDPLFVPESESKLHGSGVRHPWLTLDQQEGNFVSLVMQRREDLIDLLKHPDFDELHRMLMGVERTRA